MKKEIKTGILISDTHFPYEDKTTLRIALQLCKDLQPHYVIHLGDAIDASGISKYTAKTITDGLPEVLKEIKMFQDYLEKIKKTCKRLERIQYFKGNHCFKKGTEVLSDKGWIDISTLKGDELLASFDNKNIIFDKPLDYFKEKKDGLITIEGTYHKQVVSKDHTVYFNNMSTKKAIDITRDKENVLPHGRILERKDFDIEDNMIRLLTWIAMDGTIVYDKIYDKKRKIQFKLSKDCKIKTLENLLNQMGILYTIRKATKSGCNRLQPFYIRIYGNKAFKITNYFKRKKALPDIFYNLSKRQTDILINTIEITDGWIKDNGIFWASVNKCDVDLVQYLCILSGYNVKYKTYKNKSGFKNGKIQYITRIRKQLSNKIFFKVSTENKEVTTYCVQMPLGTIITRIDGKIALTGNCFRINDTLEKMEQRGEKEALEFWKQQFDFKKLFPGVDVYEYNQIAKLGQSNSKLYGTHGEFHGGNHLKKHLESYGCTIVYGHLHTSATYSAVTKSDSNPRKAITLPCSCNLNPAYMKNKASSWINGLGVFYMLPNGLFNLYTLEIIKGKLLFNNKLYE